jgi:hypothetical protein
VPHLISVFSTVNTLCWTRRRCKHFCPVDVDQGQRIEPSIGNLTGAVGGALSPFGGALSAPRLPGIHNLPLCVHPELLPGDFDAAGTNPNEHYPLPSMAKAHRVSKKSAHACIMRRRSSK